MISTESTPAIRPVAVDDRRVAGLGLEQVGERVAHHVVEVEDRVGLAVGLRPGPSRARGRRPTASRAGGRSESTTSACGTSAPSSFARTSAVAWPTWASGASQRSMSDDPQQREPLQRAVGADEVLDEVVGGRHQQLGRGRVLGEVAALLQDRDPVAHLDRLVDVVGDEEDRLAELGLQAQELVLQPLAVDRVDGAERLVHQHHARGWRRARGRRRPAAAGRPRAGPDSGRRSRGRGRSARAARRRAPAARSRPSRAGAGTVAMFSAIVRCGKRPICWIT